MSITAPFNFVPLSDKVFFPDWAEDVSHDIPFEDGESGVIDITITAKSPIFIRNHSSDKANPSSEFCNHNGEYYIPATSVKGMVRNVLEIMSFSKMQEDSYDDDTYAVRDLSRVDNFYMTQMKNEVLAGWLVEKEGKLIIENCGVPGRIRHEEIDKAFSSNNFAEAFKKNNFDAKNSEQKTAQFKYNLLDGIYKTTKVGDAYSSTTNAKYDKRRFHKYSANGTEGTLVVTGQPTPRLDTGKMGDGKGFEFVFFDKQEDLVVENDTFKNFKFAYFDDRTTEPKESKDWTFWKEKLSNGEKVPVFFQKQGKKVKHFGLSYLYKLPYTHSVKDGIPQSHNNSKADMAQTMFGYVDKKAKIALKGRVQFSHFKAVPNAQVMPQRTEILGTPRASYYPMYVKQNDDGYTTFMDTGFKLAGRKRYPIHKSNKPMQTDKTGNENVGTTFKPLNQNIVFQGKVRFHNLKEAELGALLSSLTFHNTSNSFHNIGMAKSLGHGKIKVTLDTKIDTQKYMKEFEMLMMQSLEKWSNTAQLTELLSMATEQDNLKNSTLKYMSLPEFAANKRRGTDEYLRNYTALDNIKKVVVKSLVRKEDLEEVARQKELLLKKQESQQIADKLYKEFIEVKSSKNIQKMDNFISRHADYEHIDEIVQLKKELQNTQENDKHQQVNDEAQKAWDGIHEPKYVKGLQKSLASFIKKWEKKNKGSDFVLELVEKAKAELN